VPVSSQKLNQPLIFLGEIFLGVVSEKANPRRINSGLVCTH
jgi:hypothetical protein